MKARICSECGGDVPGIRCEHCGRYYDQVDFGDTGNADANIIVILDRSGSMESTRQATIAGYNEFLKEQQDLGGDVAFTLVQFDDQYEVHHKAIRLKDVPQLDEATYGPRGWTALYDAIGKTLAGADKAQRTICVIVTDGQENCSKEWTQATVFEEIEKLQDSKLWEFIFLGANQDAFETGAKMGIATRGIATYDATNTGTKGLWNSTATYTCSARMGGSTASMQTLYRASVGSSNNNSSDLDSE